MKQSDKRLAEPYERPREKGFVSLLAIILVHRLNVSEKFNMGILWVSAYAVEAYELRKTSERQVVLQRQVMMNEFLPILVPHGEGCISDGELSLQVVNCGKGIAKDVRVDIKSGAIASLMTVMNDGHPVTIHADEGGEADKLRTFSRGYTAKEIRVNLHYRDIYERDLSTTGTVQVGRNRHRPPLRHAAQRLAVPRWSVDGCLEASGRGLCV